MSLDHYDGRDPLPAFNVAAWRSGVVFDIFAYDPSATDADGNPIDGPINVGKLRYRKPKRQKVERDVMSSVSEAVHDGEIHARTINEHVERIEAYAKSYDLGFDPLMGDPLKDVPSYKFYEEDANGNLIVGENGMLIERTPDAYQSVDEFKPSQKVSKSKPITYNGRRDPVVVNTDNMKMIMDLIYDVDFIKLVEDQAL